MKICERALNLIRNIFRYTYLHKLRFRIFFLLLHISRLPIIRNRIIRNVGLFEIKIELDFSALSETKLILSFDYPKRGICCAT
jgi:hypothetical protein